MQGTGAITQYIDVAQLTLYVFWLFFAGLIYYLRTEDKREGYPLESSRNNSRVKVEGFPATPKPKTFLMRDGSTAYAPNRKTGNPALNATPTAPWPGAPLQPTGNPLLAGVGPGAYSDRADTPDLTLHNENRIVPLRVATDHVVEEHGPDPRGMEVIGGDGAIGGIVRELWVDRSEAVLRYLEVEASNGRRVLLPMNFTRINGNLRQVKVQSIYGRHFADVPALKNPDQITLLEEERIMAYYGAGTLYADPARQEPFL
jgi:photosynthetic reaction center H subunit